MPLFGSKSNKSQSSLLTGSHDAHGVHSLGRSPHQTPNDSPIHSPTSQYPPPPVQPFSEAPEPSGQQRYSTFEEAHPAHTITRSQSQRVGSGSNVYQRPSVNTARTPAGESTTIYEYPPPPTEQQQSMRPEKEHKKSKRERLFASIHSSSSKENTPSNPPPLKPPGRNPSVLRKVHGQQDLDSAVPQYPQVRNPTTEYPSQSQEGLESSSENLPLSSPDGRDSPDHEQYYRQLEQQQREYDKGQFDAPPQGHPSVHQSPQYHEDVPPQYNIQQGQYQAFHPPPTRENPDIYIEDQELKPERLSLHPFERPSSRTSLGPPSPILPIQNPADSRPSTAASNNHNRFSTQSVPAQQQQGGMAGGDAPTSQGQRHQGNLQNNPQRQHSVQMETGHDSYASRQGGPPPGQRSQMLQNDQGRSTPPLSTRNRDEPSSLDYQTLLAKHEELQGKYSKVKKYYFEKDAQVTQLQNTVANQRLSMSKTSLDDNEYATRFNRLDGAINNLSFNIRKHWKGVPPWLGPFVNKDAHTVGTKEMTAVGRACITRWVVDEILDRYFHPSIEAGLSSQLKIIEKNIRRNAQNSAIQSEEHRDDLTVKLTNWRLTTLEGLSDSINGPQANEYRNALTQGLTEKLIASLQMNLADPPPQGLDSGVGSIIELAIGIAANLPIESRDVCIEYFMPGTPIVEAYMKLEPGMPPLVNPAIATQQGEFNNLGDQADAESMASGEEKDPATIEAEIREAAAKGTQAGSGVGQSRSDSVSGQSSRDKKKQSFLGGLVGKKIAPSSDGGVQRPQGGGTGQAAGVMSGEREALEKAERERERDKEGTIRFAAFVAVEVRGKAGGPGGVGNVLVKAPVYPYAS